MMRIKKPMKGKYKQPTPLLKVQEKGKDEAVSELVQCLIPALSRIHFFHLNTTSYITHMVLGELHDCLYEQLDCLAEQYVEHYGPIPDYEGHEYFKTHDELLQYLKKKVVECHSGNRGMNATVDVIHTVLVKALYQLKLK